MKIIKAAIKCSNGKIYTGKRHYQCLALSTREESIDAIQGFITDKNRFLTRNEALDLVQINGQLIKSLIGSVLTSEDLW